MSFCINVVHQTRLLGVKGGVHTRCVQVYSVKSKPFKSFHSFKIGRCLGAIIISMDPKKSETSHNAWTTTVDIVHRSIAFINGGLDLPVAYGTEIHTTKHHRPSFCLSWSQERLIRRGQVQGIILSSEFLKA